MLHLRVIDMLLNDALDLTNLNTITFGIDSFAFNTYGNATLIMKSDLLREN